MNLKENIKKELRLISEQPIPGGVANGYYRNVIGFDCSQTYQLTYGPLAGQPIPLKVNGTQLTTPFSNVATGECMLLTLPNGSPFNWQPVAPGPVVSQPFLIDYQGDFYSITMGYTQPGQCTSVVTATVVNGGGPPIYDPNGPTCAVAPCDTTPASPCAIQWFQNPNAPWVANWINNRDCSNYTWPSIHLENQANTIMAGAPNPSTSTYNNASDIWGAANASGLVPPQKNQFIAKMAKAKYSQCQKVACNC